jgi:hypothetical protein
VQIWALGDLEERSKMNFEKTPSLREVLRVNLSPQGSLPFTSLH